MNIEDKIKIIRSMESHGGSFVQTLAQAWRLADPDNRERIETTWADLFAHYNAMFCK
jgi:hypothetical protein